MAQWRARACWRRELQNWFQNGFCCMHWINMRENGRKRSVLALDVDAIATDASKEAPGMPLLHVRAGMRNTHSTNKTHLKKSSHNGIHGTTLWCLSYIWAHSCISGVVVWTKQQQGTSTWLTRVMWKMRSLWLSRYSRAVSRLRAPDFVWEKRKMTESHFASNAEKE